MDKPNLHPASGASDQEAAGRTVRVAEWMDTLESLRRDQRPSMTPAMASHISSNNVAGSETHQGQTTATSMPYAVQEAEAVDPLKGDSDDDLDTDLAKAALQTGTQAFEAQDWEEANSLLQETLRMLQQIPEQRQAFCDLFDLQYQLAVCAYHTQEPADAEGALTSLSQQPTSSDRQRGLMNNATHLLSVLYIRMGQTDHAKSECERTLQARRRLLGKRSNESLESTALMAHIYALLNNRARAKACHAMIPEQRRPEIVKLVEDSLGTKLEHLDSSSFRRSISEDSNMAAMRNSSHCSDSAHAPPMEDRCYGPVSARLSQSLPANPRPSRQRLAASREDSEGLQSVKELTVKRLYSEDETSISGATEKDRPRSYHSADPETLSTITWSPSEPSEIDPRFKVQVLSRKEILDRVGCQPRDRVEEAVCGGDHAAFESLLNRKKDFWRSKLRKRVRPERVTALHFAALFGEIDIARRLLGSGYDINEVPYGYTTSLTPLKFAIGARQAGMVDFLIANGAKPSGQDSWSSFAGQVMNRSWLMKTMSESEKEEIDLIPNQMIAVLKILLKHRWNLNAPFGTSNGTLLHQAVSFWTGSYRWDLNLRAVMTSFLCELGADPLMLNNEGKTPYDMASTSGHQDILLLLERGWSKHEANDTVVEPIELSN